MHEPVKSKSFHLVDDEGRTRAQWHLTDEGMPRMTMMVGEDGSPATVFTGLARDGQPFLHLSSHNGAARITLSLTKEGKARLHLQNSDGTSTTVTP